MIFKFKKNFIILFFLLTTITLSIINLKNTSKTHLYFLNFKTEKLTLGSFITLSFLTGLTSSFTFSYITTINNENKIFNDEKFDINSENLQDDFVENNSEINEPLNERPPERDIRDSQPTISVNYRIIKQNEVEVNDIDEGYKDNRYKNNDDWEEIESNW
tara:strand:- start:133 stop:612 length:480 start_codon:yes stop_codon:yes gene_type:complete